MDGLMRIGRSALGSAGGLIRDYLQRKEPMSYPIGLPSVMSLLFARK